MAKSTDTRFRIEAGRPHPLGAVPDAGGVNFSVYAGDASAVTLLLFDAWDSPAPIEVIELDPKVSRTFGFWHVYVGGAVPGLHYAYRADGPRDPSASGDRYNPEKVLIDPYATGVTHNLWDRARACDGSDNLDCSMRGTVVAVADYDWEGDQPRNRPMSETIIYETHAGGFTRSPSSGVKGPVTFSGIVEKIPYLRELGVTAGRTPAGLRLRRIRRRRGSSRWLATAGLLADTTRWGSSRRIRATARVPKKAATSLSSGIWSRPCTEPGSR